MRARLHGALLLASVAALGTDALVGASETELVRLVGVSARGDARGQAVVIEAAAPVPYAVFRPDPRTIVVEMPNVTTAAAFNRVRRGGLLEGAVIAQDLGIDGTTVARVRLRLAAAASYRVRSDRNTILVDLERTASAAARAPAPGSPAAADGGGGTATGGGTEPPDPPALVAAASPVAIDPMAALKLVDAPQPASQPALPGALSATGEGQEKRYTGHPISLDFQNADLRAVLRTFVEISGLNMVIDPNVQGTVDIVLTDVPWDQALETILRANNLGYVVEGNIVRIARLETLQAEQEQKRKLQEAQALAGELRVRTFTLSYAKAADLAQLVTQSALSPRGQLQVDQRTNTLILRDLPERLDTAANLIGVLDRPEPQVEVEARVVQTTREFARAIGIQWGFSGRMTPELGNTTTLTFPNRIVAGGRNAAQGPNADVRGTPLESVPNAVDLGVTGEARSAAGIQLGAINGAFNLDVALSALERSGKGRVLSTPRLTTQNNVEAEVAQGIQIPLQTVANNTVTVTFKDAVLLLKVTPQITSANTVIMNITIENASPDFSRQVNNIPPIDTQRAITRVQVNDGATTVIGGIFVSREQSLQNRTPVLHRIPLLGWLFRRDSISDESRELLIFITPRIIRG
ncbi:MAG TPA: type IV pilus secretin PilQ [Vicinamibacterales bacterium]|nr:type IV pilus secretin PilQ [Vicinamibacterales bacterium]